MQEKATAGSKIAADKGQATGYLVIRSSSCTGTGTLRNIYAASLNEDQKITNQPEITDRKGRDIGQLSMSVQRKIV